MRLQLFAALLAAACGGQAARSVAAAADCETAWRVPMSARYALDLLFVVDRSTAMAPWQESLLRNAARIMQVIETRRDPLDLRIGVVSADLADGGVVRGPLSYVDHLAAPPTTSFSGTLEEAIVPLISVGTDGAAAAQPLEALRLAAPGWARANAYLGVVIIAAADDASPASVTSYHDALAAAKGNPHLIVASVVTPEAAPRLVAFAQSFGDHGTALRLTTPDWTDAVAPLFARGQVLVFPACIEPDVDVTDVSPDPGLQLGCSVVDERLGGEHDVIPRCGDAKPCWKVTDDPIACTQAPHLRFDIERADYVELGTTTALRCPAVCPAAE
jgi:hypothetical protein